MASAKRLRTLLFTLCWSAFFFPSLWGDSDSSASSPSQDEIVLLEAFQVLASEAVSPELDYSADFLRAGTTSNLGESLLRVPGIYGHKRGSFSLEPSIRGLGFDRVVTEINGLPLFNAAPTHTASPVSQIGPVTANSITVVKALPSVTLGTPSTGGRILVDDSMITGDHEQREISGFVGTTYQDQREGFMHQAALKIMGESYGIRLSGFLNDLGDYESGNGSVVSSRYHDWGTSALLSWQPADPVTTQFYLHYRRLEDSVNFSLPLDSKNSEMFAASWKLIWEADGPSLQRILFKAGYGRTDPYLDNASRVYTAVSPPRPTIYAQSSGISRNFSLTTVWNTAGNGVLRVGADYSDQDRNTVRHRLIGPNHFLDHIWPSVKYEKLGVFGELQKTINEKWDVRVGLRADKVNRDAGDADEMAFNRTAREWYQLYHGTSAGKTSRTDDLISGNIVMGYRHDEALNTFFGLGLSMQAPMAEDAYHAFLQNLGGGWRLGNPSLKPEKKLEFDWGGRWKGRTFEFSWDVYYFDIEDFVYLHQVGVTPAPPPAPPPPPGQPVYSYNNVDASLYGAELGLVWKATEKFTIPVSVALARGHNDTLGRDLPEIPPLELRAALHFTGSSSIGRYWWEAGFRFVDSKVNPAPQDINIYSNTGSFATFDLKTGLSINEDWKVEAGIENLFDKQYFEYLRPPIAEGTFLPASGNLSPGDRIPNPGRSLYLSLKHYF